MRLPLYSQKRENEPSMKSHCTSGSLCSSSLACGLIEFTTESKGVRGRQTSKDSGDTLRNAACKSLQTASGGQPPHTVCLLLLLQETRSRILEQSKSLYYSPARTQRTYGLRTAGRSQILASGRYRLLSPTLAGPPVLPSPLKQGSSKLHSSSLSLEDGPGPVRRGVKQLLGGCVRVRGGESGAPDQKPRWEQEGERPPCCPGFWGPRACGCGTCSSCAVPW